MAPANDHETTIGPKEAALVADPKPDLSGGLTRSFGECRVPARGDRFITFKSDEVTVPRNLIREVLRLIDELRPRPAQA